MFTRARAVLQNLLADPPQNMYVGFQIMPASNAMRGQQRRPQLCVVNGQDKNEEDWQYSYF